MKKGLPNGKDTCGFHSTSAPPTSPLPLAGVHLTPDANMAKHGPSPTPLPRSSPALGTPPTSLHAFVCHAHAGQRLHCCPLHQRFAYMNSTSTTHTFCKHVCMVSQALPLGFNMHLPRHVLPNCPHTSPTHHQWAEKPILLALL